MSEDFFSERDLEEIKLLREDSVSAVMQYVRDKLKKLLDASK